jgi:hypothetical protein
MNSIIIISFLVIYLFFAITKFIQAKPQTSLLIDFNKAYEVYKENYYKNKPRKIDEKKTYIKNGYLLFSDSNRSVHRWVIEKHLGRRLKKEEVVHHIDGNKLNNNIENLQLFKNQDEHHAHHLNNLRTSGNWYKKAPVYFYHNNLSYTR